MIEYFDISQSVNVSSAVFPGDQPFRRHVALSFDQGHHLELSSVQTTLHIGTHADAPSHYLARGPSMENRPLENYMGRCQVVRVTLPRRERINIQHIQHVLLQAPRILFCTNSFPDPHHWREDFNSLDPALVHFLAQQGVRLIGLDTPSVDPAASKNLPSHHALAEHDLAVLEGLVLSHVPEGVYSLMALPLKWEGVEASPVRAILVPYDQFPCR